MVSTIAMLSTYPPSQCGIATFAQSLMMHMESGGCAVIPIRLVDEATVGGTQTSEWVRDDYVSMRRAAAALNQNDAIVIQHEFGIYGGSDGSDLLDLLEYVRVPVITVLHTVLTNPSHHQREVMSRILDYSDCLVTMTETARDRLISGWSIHPGRVTVIPHGADDNRLPQTLEATDRRPTVLTWGLLGVGKGIEWGIRALSGLKDLEPAPIYRVVGQTHPRVRERDGEAYRERLVTLAESLGVADLVEFDDRYLSSADLRETVRAADVVLLPYDSREQVTSGVLIDAIAAGKPVVSTAFPHAVELLTRGAGLLVPQGDADSLSHALRRVLTEPSLAASLGEAAHREADGVLWPAVAGRYLELAAALSADKALAESRPVVSKPVGVDLRHKQPAPQVRSRELVTVAATRTQYSVDVPYLIDVDVTDDVTTEAEYSSDSRALGDSSLRVEFDPVEQSWLLANESDMHPFRHVFAMSTDIGIYEHSLGAQPRIEHGYCVDDVARALALTVRHRGDSAVDELTAIYFAFVVDAIAVDGRMHNRRNINGEWTDDTGLGDHWGRAIRALGTVSLEADMPNRQYAADRAVTQALRARSPWIRSISGAVVGCSDVLKANPDNISARRYLMDSRSSLGGVSHDPVWPWPESRLTYGNAAIPEALIALGSTLGDHQALDDGLTLLAWLVSEQTVNGHISVVPVGGRTRNGGGARFDQQPIEVATLAEAAVRAFEITGDTSWSDVVAQCADWFHGANDVGVPVYNHSTGGGHDGLHATRVNANQGAESTLAALTTFQLADRIGARKKQ